MKLYLLFLLGLILTVENGRSTDLKLANPFQDHMVLQRQMPVPIWGWTDPTKTVTVKIGDKSATATGDTNGYWCAKLPAMEANATGQDVTITDGAKTITLKDVLIGEVWICAGQSNMSRPVKEEMIENPQAPKDVYADTDYPQVRFINYPNACSDMPLTDMDPVIDGKAAWQIVSPQTAGDSMCMAFFFGRDLYKDLQVPVGLVQIAVAGTTQTAWGSKAALDATPSTGARTYTYDDCFAASEKAQAAGKDPFKSWADWKTADAAWRAHPTGRWPASLAIMDYPSVLYNALVYPLAPMALRGVIWHQGEAGPAMNYGARMVAIVNDWRKLYGQNFWFITGTMTRFTTHGPPLIPAIEALRSGINDEFAKEESLFGAGGNGIMVGMLDLGNVGTHWQRKDEAGRRLARAAMDHVYGKPSVYTGPQLVDSKIEGTTVTLKFDNVGTGLKYAPSIDGISGFILQGKDKAVWATPTIQGTDTVVLSDPAVADPVNVFYAYQANPHETLFNSEGLPAYSFKLKDGPPVPRDKPPFELAKPAAQQDGKDVPLGDLTPDAQGNRFVQVQAESNGPPVVLYDAAQPDALSSANTKRY
jgi:sialate O-acetylesterase